MLNAAPARAVSPELMALVDVLIVNRVEAADMLGLPEIGDAAEAARGLAALGPAAVIVTLGSGARDVTVTGGDKSELTRYLRAALARLGLKETGESNPERGYYYRSDHFSMAKRGVPMLYIERGSDWVEGGTAAGEKASQAYTDTAYHGPNDEFSESWNWSGVQQDVELIYVLGRMLAQGKDWPNWHEGDEFRRIRDESRASLTK